jgi:hypothetical protein
MRHVNLRMVNAIILTAVLGSVVFLRRTSADHDGTVLSVAQLQAIRGAADKPCGPPCAACWIDYENYVWDCLSPYPSDNTCSQRSCVGVGGTCGGGKQWTNNWIAQFANTGHTTYNEMLDTQTVKPCYATITCNTGGADALKSCNGGSVGANDSFPGWAGVVGQGCLVPMALPPTGCRPCTPNPPNPLNVVSKVDPDCVDCPFRDCSL